MSRIPTACLLSLAVALVACSDERTASPAGSTSAAANEAVTGLVQVDGSSTLYPLTEAVAEEFQASNGGRIRVTVGVSGTGGGFKKFCRGEIDVQDASRPIKASELADCAAQGIKFLELPVAYDALTVVINPANTFAKTMTVNQLKTIWAPQAQGTVMRWNQVDPSWPDQPITLYGPGADSGTFDYFTEAVVGESKASRGDYTASEDDNVLVQGVSQDINALGYFGYGYYAENQGIINAVAIVPVGGGEGVVPNSETVRAGSYTPLARPLFIYVSTTAMERPEVSAFIDFYMNEAAGLAEEVRYVPLPDEVYVAARRHITERRTGTIFGEGDATAVSMDDLIHRETSE